MKPIVKDRYFFAKLPFCIAISMLILLVRYCKGLIFVFQPVQFDAVEAVDFFFW